jgi:hypothetical protein
MKPMDYAEAMDVLRSWAGREVMVVAFVEPGVSLAPFTGELSVEDGSAGIVRGVVANGGPEPVRIAFPSGTFHEAFWVPGHEDRGLSVVQGATRVDVFVED